MKSIRRAYLEKRNKTLLNNNSNLTEDKKDNYNQKTNKNNINQSQSKILYGNEEWNIRLHEDNLEKIEKLKKELYDLEKEYNFTSNKINSLKKLEKKENDDYNKIIIDIKNEEKQLNKLKEINTIKNNKYIQLRNQHREMLLRLFHSLHGDVTNELNRQVLHRFFDRIRERIRSDNNNGPRITNEQIQSLPISYYPNRHNYSNQKCTICGFPFCYNDVIIKLRRCNHIFHKACLTNSLTSSRASVCPICKKCIF